MERLTYENYRGCKDILTIDLHNDYTVIAIKSWNPDEHKYIVQLMLKENTVDKWDLIEKAESIEFNVDYKIINKTILKHVATLLSDRFFDYYIDRYEYELKCFDIGNNLHENNLSCSLINLINVSMENEELKKELGKLLNKYESLLDETLYKK